MIRHDQVSNDNGLGNRWRPSQDRTMPVPGLPSAREEFAADIGVMKAINKAQSGHAAAAQLGLVAAFVKG
jgi:hypothetical protein